MVIALLLYSVGFAQIAQEDSFETELDSITTENQASEFVKQHKSLHGKFETFNRVKHHSRLANDLFNLNKGGKEVYESEIGKTYYKMIERKEVPHHRVSYIVLDGNKKSLAEISKLRKEIISKYHQGTSFEKLAKTYSMDINGLRGGDTGWFAHGEMAPEFENKIVNDHHKVGAIFTMDIPSRKWYYVILKTYGKKMIEEIKVLKIVEPISN